MQENKNLIRNCLEIFQTQGLKVTMDDIAGTLGMSKRTLYEIFENKENLILQCVYQLFVDEQARTDIDLSKNPNIIEELFPILNHDIFNRAKKLKNLFENIKKYYPQVFDKLVATHFEKYRSRIGRVVTKGIQQGFFRDDINVEIVQIFFFDLQTTSKHNKELFERFPVEEIFLNTILCFVRGISTSKGIELIEGVLHRDYPYFNENNKCKKNYTI